MRWALVACTNTACTCSRCCGDQCVFDQFGGELGGKQVASRLLPAFERRGEAGDVVTRELLRGIQYRPDRQDGRKRRPA